MIDYLIVGQGLSGSCFALECLEHTRSFLVIDNDHMSASKVASGIFNPVVLKRFSSVWRAKEQLEQMHSTFARFENLLNNKYVESMPLFRLIHDKQELFTWSQKSKLEHLKDFLACEFYPNPYPFVKTSEPMGRVKACGRILIESWLEDFRSYLQKRKLLIKESFDHTRISFKKNTLIYKDCEYKKIVFCEGHQLTRNPYFGKLPLIANKGEILRIRAAKLKLKEIIKSKIFLLPQGDGHYLAGATYNQDFKTSLPTKEGREELLKKLKEFLGCEFEIIDQKAGLRPTVLDRRPLLGCHPEKPGLALLNGMGTRGTLLAPSMAKLLFDHLENKHSLPPEVDLKRFWNEKQVGFQFNSSV